MERFAKKLNKDKRTKKKAIFKYGEDRQALAFSLRRPSRLRRSGRAYVEYVADMKVADTLWTSTDSLLTSTDSQRTSTDFLLTSTDFHGLSNDSLLTSTDSLLTSTDSLLTFTDALLTSTNFF